MATRKFLPIALLVLLSFTLAFVSSASAYQPAQSARNFTIDETAAELEAVPRSVTTFTGSVSRGRDSTKHSFTVPSGTAKITAKLTMPSGADFDLSMWDNQNRRTGGWTRTDHTVKTNIPNSVYSGVSSNPEWVNVTNPVTTGTWKVGCYAYSGSGTYTITV
ncbi:hypothetical protein KEJ15_04920, partial [Candidatus Bathyarchaeota archaeon]|nr:hypothetical protein [Candidatus Bathyarchaeota archaeon]